MNKFNSLVENTLNEINGGNVYHYTKVDNAIKILSSDKLSLSPTVFHKPIGKNTDLGASEYGHSKGMTFFLSLARTKTTSYTDGKVGKISPEYEFVGFVLDGTKLDNNFESIPTSYFDKSYSFEAENRIVSNKPYINNIKKYIKHVDIIRGNKSYSQIPHLLYMLDKDNIKYTIYDSREDHLKNKVSKVVIDKKENEYVFLGVSDDSPVFSEMLPVIKSGNDKLKSLIDSPSKTTFDEFENVKSEYISELSNAMYTKNNSVYTVGFMTFIRLLKRLKINNIHALYAILNKLPDNGYKFK